MSTIQQGSVSDVLGSFQATEASDPRDKVYGFLAFPASPQLPRLRGSLWTTARVSLKCIRMLRTRFYQKQNPLVSGTCPTVTTFMGSRLVV